MDCAAVLDCQLRAAAWAIVLIIPASFTAHADPVATNFLVNGGVDVSDAQVTGGVFDVQVALYDPLGVESRDCNARNVFADS